MHDLPELPAQQPHVFNFGHELRRTNATQRPPRVPARVQRLGHVVLQTHQVPRDAELVPRQPRDDRQRLPVLPRPARPRTGDELHPLRPRRHAHRPPHPGAGARARQPLRALRLSGVRPRRAGRGRRIPARARLFPVVGHRPAHPGQPDLRLLARSRRLPRRALRRRRHVRQHARARLGAVHRVGPGPVGTTGHQGLPRHQPRKRAPPRSCARCSPRSATTTNSTSPACAAY